jgi:hypothetical protein
MGILLGISFGIFLLIAISFAYFFGAGKTIDRSMAPIIGNHSLLRKLFPRAPRYSGEFGLKVNYYLTGHFHTKKVRQVEHYRQEFIDAIFKRHHIAAVVCMSLAFIFLIAVGFLLEVRFFEMPAAASMLIFFSVMIAFIGALTYFLQSWSLPLVILLAMMINFLLKNNYIDPRNKAYGLDYSHMGIKPIYSKKSLQALCTYKQVTRDKSCMIEVLERWKKKQGEEKPLMVFINVSGGGLRSAAFVMNTLQKLDSSTGGRLMQHTFMISGASGGMLAATYYRELYRKKKSDSTLNIYNPAFTNRISIDLLNPVFSSMIARDIFAPMQKFSVGQNSYVKDRGYAFEKKLGDNTDGLLNLQLKDLESDESMARVPMMIFNSVVKSDGRKILISTQPLSFMMKPRYFQADNTVSADAIDFGALFKNQHPMNLRLLTALRMNATFPYVLPNVWLPSNPVIDVMDAGIRDNVGTETSLRFIDNFKDWIKTNTSGVVLLEIIDRPNDGLFNAQSQSLSDMVVTPAIMLQQNWFNIQSYYQTEQYNYFAGNNAGLLKKITLRYTPSQIEKAAALNFHLSAREKRDILESFYSDINTTAVNKIQLLLSR